MHRKLLKVWRWLTAALVAAGVAAYLAPRDVPEALLLPTLREPALLRSVKFADEPLRAVGGSRDGANLIATYGKFQQRYIPGLLLGEWKQFGTQPHIDAMVGDLMYRVGQCDDSFDGRREADDVDIASGARPRWCAARLWVEIGDFKRGSLRSTMVHAWRRVALFAPDETKALLAGSHFKCPGCTTGEYPGSASILQERHWTKPPPSYGDDDYHRKYAAYRPREIAPNLGVAGAAWSPDGRWLALVGVDSSWARHMRLDPKASRSAHDTGDVPADPTKDFAAVKIWDAATLALRWKSEEPWPAVPFDGTRKPSPLAPCFCGYSGNGATLHVGWARDASERNGYGWFTPHSTEFRYEFVRHHDAATGEVLSEQRLPMTAVERLAVVGVRQESLVAANADGLWRKPLDGAGDWRKLDLPKLARVTALKTTRDRRHLLVGDAAGVLHVVGWP